MLQPPEKLRSLAKGRNWNVDVLEMDVTHEASVNQAVRQTLDRAGRIDVVINNAGIGAQGTEAYTIEQFQQVPDVNLSWTHARSIARYCHSCGVNITDCSSM